MMTAFKEGDVVRTTKFPDTVWLLEHPGFGIDGGVSRLRLLFGEPPNVWVRQRGTTWVSRRTLQPIKKPLGERGSASGEEAGEEKQDNGIT